MNNRIKKIAITLGMLLVIAAPAQAFAAEKCDVQTTTTQGSNNTAIYNQIKEQLGKSASQAEIGEQVKLALQKTQLPGQTKLTNAGTPAKTTTTAAQPTADTGKNTTTGVQSTDNTAKTTPATAAPTANTAKTTTATAAPAANKANNTAAAPASASYGSYEQQVVDLVNQERAAAGLPALKVNTQLSGVAEKKAEDLRDNNYFDHNSPVYGSPFDMMKQFGISYTTAGENIAKGQKTPADVMNGWMNSPGHRANILNSSFTEIGVGYVTDSNGTTYWVQHFIRP